MRERPTDEQLQANLDAATNYDHDAALASVRARLDAFEDRFGMKTEEMRRKVVNDEMPESDDILAWLMVHNRYRALQRRA